MRTLRRRRFRPLPPPRRIDRPRHFFHNPDAGVMRSALQGYDARGVRVLLGVVDMDLTGRVEQQLSGGPMALFLVRLDEPVEQEEYETALDLPWGRAKPVFEQARREGRLDREGRLTRLTVPWGYLTLDAERAPKGALAEYQTVDPAHVSSMRDTPGRIVGKEALAGGDAAILLELFEPLPRWQLPAGIVAESVRAGFQSKTAYFIPKRMYQWIVDASHDPNTGLRWARVREWIGGLGPPVEGSPDMMPLADPKLIDEIKRRGIDLSGHESWMVLYFVVPIGWPSREGVFRPMRMDLAKGLELEVFEGAEWLEGLS